ncbi:hypothetical protein [Legionella waltersii]|uniref:Uncharacterized protein n=1 Tax=Legionella waltersii TaxID=66969 RepID=A0A0W1A4S8_9GAMM|nr:hypothetical protein [Legionella waltersii]KTD76330.1 hypothetical protein Lwal_2052 [Legionella waltersii]SNV13769.1 Uncharacterised protein [Legionella waltersii]
MESKSEFSSVIFSKNIDEKQANLILDARGARQKPSGQKWLLRESSIDGLLTISYFYKEMNSYRHIRIGFKDNEWQVAPSDRKEAKQFVKEAQFVFKDALPENSHESLLRLLTEEGFDLSKQVRPNPTQATSSSQYSSYSDDAFNEAPQKNRYSTF